MTFDSTNDAQVFALQAFAQNDANVRSFLDALAAAVPADQQDAIAALYMTPAQTQVQDALNALAAQAQALGMRRGGNSDERGERDQRQGRCAAREPAEEEKTP